MTSAYPGQREIAFTNFEDILAGTLFLPEVERPKVALAMLQGSGATDRDNFDYFPWIREILLAAGVAVLAWDKPGVGFSTGDWRRQNLTDRAREAVSAIQFLREQPELAGSRIGLFGHSQGGWVAPIAAAVAPEQVDFIVVQSGPGISPREQALFDVEHSMRASGHSENEVQEGASYVRRLQEAADRDVLFDEVRSLVLTAYADHPCLDYFSILDEMMWNYFRKSWQEDPHPETILPQVRCPVLALFGKDDVLVPSELSARVFTEALSSSGNDDVTVQVFPNADHTLLDPVTRRFVDGYAELLAGWVHQQARLNST